MAACGPYPAVGGADLSDQPRQSSCGEIALDPLGAEAGKGKLPSHADTEGVAPGRAGWGTAAACRRAGQFGGAVDEPARRGWCGHRCGAWSRCSGNAACGAASSSSDACGSAAEIATVHAAPSRTSRRPRLTSWHRPRVSRSHPRIRFSPMLRHRRWRSLVWRWGWKPSSASQ